jgi:hypothetical protein
MLSLAILCSGYSPTVEASICLCPTRHIGSGGSVKSSRPCSVDRALCATVSNRLTLFVSYDVSTSLVELGPVAPIVHVLNRYATQWETLYLQYAGLRSASPEFISLFSSAGWSSLRRIYSLRNYSGPKGDKATLWGQLTHLDITRTLSY